VEHDGAVRGPAHARVADPQQVGDALAEQLRRDRQVAPLGHPRPADGTGVAQHHDRARVDVERGVVDAGGEVVDVVEHDRAALVLQERGVGGRDLHHRPVRAERAAQDDEAAAAVEGPRPRADHLLVPDRRGRDVLRDRAARHGRRVEVEHVRELGHHGRQAARVVEVLHQVPAGGLEVDEPRRRRAQLVEQAERQLDADAPGEREQVQDRVRRAADRVQHADRVLERLAREDRGGPLVLLHHRDDPPAGRLREPGAPRVDRRDRRAARQRHPEALGNARHRRRGPHRHAVAVRPRDRVLDLDELLLGDPAGAQLLVVVPAVAAGAELESAPVPVQHRPAGHDDRRHVGAREAHQARRVRLVAAGQRDDAVERVRADGLLDVHRHQVPVEHRRRLHQGLAERDDGELQREAAGLQHAALDRLGEPAQVDVAVDELAPAVADPDHGSAAERLVREPLRLEPRAVQEAVEVAAVEPLAAAPPAVAVVRADVAHQPRRSCLSARYSATTSAVSSWIDVSVVSLSSVISPCWSRTTRSQTSSTWT
jgi:hypothetical protein